MPGSFERSGFLATTACIWEATARKVGNVHRYADFADTTYLDFVFSAVVIAEAVDRVVVPPPGSTTLSPGVHVWSGVRRTRTLTGRNTNLGILLLLFPLARVPGYHVHTNPPTPDDYDLRAGIPDVLAALTTEDAKYVYRAIRLAQPGGLGDAPEQDVRAEPTVTLLEAMKLAADRDMVARQYANGFADVFDFGVPAFLDAFGRFGCVEAAIIDSQFRWLAQYPDSLIARKNGPAVAEDVRQRAAAVLALGGLASAEGRRAGVALDRHLRSDGNKLNPGTTADLITASLFVALREGRVTPAAPFRWNAEDWL